MLSKNEIKDIQSLSQKKFRDALKLFVAEGPKIVGELIQLVPDKVESIYATPEWIDRTWAWCLSKNGKAAARSIAGKAREELAPAARELRSALHAQFGPKPLPEERAIGSIGRLASALRATFRT